MEKLPIEFRDKKLFVRLFGPDIYVVGGFIRDAFLDRASEKTIDFLITRHSVEDITARIESYGKVDLVGKSFGVIKFTIGGHTYDLSLPRKDHALKARRRGHKDFFIDSDPEIPLEIDLRRRDFRCNSMALRLIDDALIDPFDGRADIQDRLIRLTNPEAFPEDPLRIIRAARFASVLGFHVEPNIYRIAKDIDLSGLSVERITEELYRILLESKLPSRGMEELFRLGALRQLLPELYRLTLSIQDSIFHPEKDDYGHHTVWQHTKLTLDQARRLARKTDWGHPRTLILLLAALFHDVGKAATALWEFKQERMVITNKGHDIAGEKMTRDIFDRLKIFSWNGTDLRTPVLELIRCHHRASELWQNRDIVTKKAFNRLAADIHGEIELLVFLDAADRTGRNEIPAEGLDEAGEWLLAKFEELNVSRETIRPLIMGRDLLAMDVAPGPGMGRILKKIYQLQLDNEFDNREDGLKIVRRLIDKETQ